MWLSLQSSLALMALQVSPSASSKIRRARRAKSARTALPLACCRSSTISASIKFIVSSKEVIYYLFKRYGPLVHPVLLPSNELDQVLPNQGIACTDGHFDVRKGRSVRQGQCGGERESSLPVGHLHLAILELVDRGQEVARCFIALGKVERLAKQGTIAQQVNERNRVVTRLEVVRGNQCLFLISANESGQLRLDLLFNQARPPSVGHRVVDFEPGLFATRAHLNGRVLPAVILQAMPNPKEWVVRMNTMSISNKHVVDLLDGLRRNTCHHLIDAVVNSGNESGCLRSLKLAENGVQFRCKVLEVQYSTVTPHIGPL